jgi:hypothetical protein
MASPSQNPPNRVSPRRLWFGFAGSAASWVCLGVGYVLITWWACVENGRLGGGTPRPGTELLYCAAAVLLIGVAFTAGFISYRNWRQLSTARTLGEAEGRGRAEFMALIGVFISFTLGFGLFWLTLPLFILNLCVRVR